MGVSYGRHCQDGSRNARCRLAVGVWRVSIMGHASHDSFSRLPLVAGFSAESGAGDGGDWEKTGWGNRMCIGRWG